MTAVTFLPRLLPLLALSRRALPAAVRTWLSYVPVAVLAALLGPILFVPPGGVSLQPGDNPYFWAALPAFVVALSTKNMFLTVLTGIISLACLRQII